MSASVFETTVFIPTGSSHLVGRLYRNVANLLDPQPALIVSGSWLTVKEQMAALYARELSARGFTALTFDFAGWGQSSGFAPQTEIPAQKILDIAAVANFLRTLSCVRGGRVGYLAICASAMYAAAAIDRGAPIDSFASIAGWFHDTSTVAAYYGGPEGVAERLARASEAAGRLLESWNDSMVPAYEEGNDRAAMFIPLDYYASPARGRIPAWRNEMSEISWLHWLSFDGMSSAERLNVPTLFVHGDECALPDNVKRIHREMKAPRQLVWHPGFQVDFYDRPDLVSLSVDAAAEHFSLSLGDRRG